MTAGWCTNVLPAHRADLLAQTLHTMTRCLPTEAPIGLWLPDALLGSNPDVAVTPIRSVLDQCGLHILGLNAFPFGDFHADRVKDAVYAPAWDQPVRADYTRRAAQAALALCGDQQEIGITTVPIGWPAHDVDLGAAATALRQTCQDLEALSNAAGRTVFLAIEPEPCCILPTAASLADFIEAHGLEDACRKGTLRACLDACHLAVEHESPSDAIAALDRVGMQIGRVQVSSAPEATGEAIEALRDLSEPRWMHQTTVSQPHGLLHFDDLSMTDSAPRSGVWRTHLHVPVHCTTLGQLDTTQSWITSLLRAVARTDQRPPVEIETYAWSVLPASYRQPTIQAEIARELEWTVTAMLEVGW